MQCAQFSEQSPLEDGRRAYIYARMYMYSPSAATAAAMMISSRAVVGCYMCVYVILAAPPASTCARERDKLARKECQNIAYNKRCAGSLLCEGKMEQRGHRCIFLWLER